MEKENNENKENIRKDLKIKRRIRQKDLAKEILHEYATNTTLHGLPYTTRKGVTAFEKIFWILTFVSSICLCSFLISDVWIKWQTNPVIVSIGQTLIPVTEIPFPSVTICPQLKIKKSVYDYDSTRYTLLNQVKNFFLSGGSAGNIDFKGFAKLDDVSRVCEDWRVYSDINPRFHNLLLSKATETSEIESIISVAPRKEDIFVLCKWHNQTADMNCSKTLTEIVTSEGLCYNVNSLAAQEILRDETNTLHFNADKKAINWTMEGGYSSTGPYVYPSPGKAFGATPDLKIIFRDQLSEHGTGCNTINHGFNKVFIQHPADLPQSSLFYYPVRNGEVSTLALSFSMIETAASVKKYSPEIRRCYFAGEINLKYFKIYTSNNCLMECIANITLELCKCVGFYMPHDNTTSVCGFDDTDCMDTAREKLVNLASQGDKACICLPLCYAIDYQADNMKASFDYEKLLAQYYIRDEGNVSYSALQMFYKAPRFMSMYRSELFGRTDFFANIGGLLGLFLGFSFLSLIEVFYYITLRLCCLLKKDLKETNTQRAVIIETEKY